MIIEFYLKFLQYSHVFDDTVLDNFKCWVVEDILEGSTDVCNWKRELGKNKPTDFEMLKTYATGLLATSLAGYAVLFFFPIIFAFLFFCTFYSQLLFVT